MNRTLGYLWFASSLGAAALLTVWLARVDRWMFDHGAEHLDWQAYRANRLAATSLPSERIDERQHEALRGE